MEACAVICRKATVMLPDANFLSSRAQNRGFCAFLAFGTPVFGHFEHKIGIFVRFRPPEPPFSGVSSTKSGFLCSFTKLDVGVGGLSRRKRHRCTCVAYTTADATAVAPAQPSHLRSRCTCAAAVPAAVACCSSLPSLHLTARAG